MASSTECSFSVTIGQEAYARLRTTDVRHAIDFAQACLRRYFHDDASVLMQLAEPTAHQAYDVLRLNKAAGLAAAALRTSAAQYGLAVQLETYRRRTMAMNMAAIKRTLTVARPLEESRIPYAFMKGPLQQQLLYGDALLKPVADVDLLVTGKDFARARLALKGIGYEVAETSRSFWWRGFLAEEHLVDASDPAGVVDLHYQVHQPGAPGPRDVTPLLSRARPVEAAGGSVLMISDCAILIVACVNLVKAMFNREPGAGYACDVLAAARRISENRRDEIFAQARALRLHGTLLLGLRATDTLLRGTGPLFSGARGTLDKVSDETLRDMVIAPWLDEIDWPKRRNVLWELCNRQPTHFLAEATRATASELGRRIFERGLR